MSFVFGDLFPDERSYRPGEVARRLGMHVDTIRRWIDAGDYESFRVSGQRRIPYESLRSMIAQKMPESSK